jgi:hypothetical protein
MFKIWSNIAATATSPTIVTCAFVAHRVVFSQPMFVAPLGDGLGEFLVEVRLVGGWLGHHFEGSNRFAADSTSA